MWWLQILSIALGAERCNGVDDDGDGVADEAPTVWFADADGDGFGDEAAPLFASDCVQPAGYVAERGD